MLYFVNNQRLALTGYRSYRTMAMKIGTGDSWSAKGSGENRSFSFFQGKIFKPCIHPGPR